MYVLCEVAAILSVMGVFCWWVVCAVALAGCGHSVHSVCATSLSASSTLGPRWSLAPLSVGLWDTAPERWVLSQRGWSPVQASALKTLKVV